MRRTVAELLDELGGMLTGTDLDNVTDLNGALSRAARVMAQNVDIPEASSKKKYSIFDQVTDYLADDGIFGSALTDFRPQGVSRSPFDEVYKEPIKLFDQTKCLLPNGVALTFEYDLGVPKVRVAGSRANAAANLDPMNSVTGWAAGGTASNLANDSTFYYQSPAALRMLLTGAGTGYIEKTLNSALNLSTYEDVGTVFLAIETPSAANLSSLEVRIGSSSVNYNNLSVIQGFLGAWQTGEFLLVAFDMSLASQTGTPNWSAINYVRASAVTAGTITNFRVGGLFIALPSPYLMLFQTAAVFNASGVLSNEISTPQDIIILNDAAYTIYQHECAIAIIEQLAGGVSKDSAQRFTDTLHGTAQKPGLYKLYRANNPSPQIREVGSWGEIREF